MARLKGALQVTGNIGGVSIYKMKGCNDPIVRVKGGVTREQIETLESCSKVRKNNKEWSGVAQMAGAIRRTVKPIAGLADYNFCGQLSAISKNIQKKDETMEPGQRSIHLSQYKELLSGFQLNEKHPFKSTALMPITWNIDRDKREATVGMEKSNPVYQLKNFTSLSNFRFVITLGCVSDIAYDPQSEQYIPTNNALPEVTSQIMTEWFQIDREIPAQTLSLQAPDLQNPMDECTSLVLGIGIEFAQLGVTGIPLADKTTGCGQILGVR